MTTKMEISKIFFLLVCVGILKTEAVNQTPVEQTLYNDLFRNYATHLRPVLQTDTTITVTVGFLLSQVEKVDEVDQQLISHGILTVLWQDDLLQWDPSLYDNQDVLVLAANKVWLPEVTPTNSALDAVPLSSFSENSKVRFNHLGQVLWTLAIKLTTRCGIDVTDFPYDTQTCDIEFGSWMYMVSHLNFSLSGFTRSVVYTSNAEWELVELKSDIVTSTSNVQTVTQRVVFTLTLRRDPTYYVMYLVGPSVLLSLLIIPMFILPVDSGERVSLGITMMLAFSIFLLMMTDITPRSSNLPKFSVFIIVCTVMSGVATVVSILIMNIHHHNPVKPVPRWLKRFILIKLARILCCMKYTDNNENEIGTDHGQPYSETNVSSVEKLAVNNKKDTLSEILDFLKSKKLSDDIVDDNRADWNNLARVLDRLCLVVFTLILICLFIIFFS